MYGRGRERTHWVKHENWSEKTFLCVKILKIIKKPFVSVFFFRNSIVWIHNILLALCPTHNHAIMPSNCQCNFNLTVTWLHTFKDLGKDSAWDTKKCVWILDGRVIEPEKSCENQELFDPVFSRASTKWKECEQQQWMAETRTWKKFQYYVNILKASKIICEISIIFTCPTHLWCVIKSLRRTANIFFSHITSNFR